MLLLHSHVCVSQATVMVARTTVSSISSTGGSGALAEALRTPAPDAVHALALHRKAFDVEKAYYLVLAHAYL